MTAENNEKYIAEAWINDKEEEEFKKSFLKELLLQWQGHGNGFDADTVDGMHWQGTDESDGIENYIQHEIADLMRNFSIGYTFFSAANDNYLLGFDAIHLYNEDDDHTSDTEPYNKLPWDINKTRDENNIPTLWQTFEELYKLSYIGTEDEASRGLTNYDIYTTLKNEFHQVELRLAALEKALEGKIIEEDGEVYLNSDSVNGLRFFIYNPEQYEQLQELAAQYDPNFNYNPENEEHKKIVSSYKKLNSIHNVFIIKTKQEIIDSGYSDGVYDFNPDTNIIDKFYHFRVVLATGEDGINRLYLQYRHEDKATWENLCPAEDFIDYNKVKETVYDVIEDESTYTLNPTPFYNALKDIDITEVEESELPIIIYGKENFLKGAYYNYKANTQTGTSIPVVTINNFKYLNFNGFQKYLEDKIGAVEDNLNEFEIDLIGGTNADGEVVSGKLDTIEGRITENENNITSIIGDSHDGFNLGTAQTKIENLKETHDGDVDRIDEDIASLKNWSGVFLKKIDRTYSFKDEFGNPKPSETFSARNFYNNDMKLAMFTFKILHYHYGKDAGKWVELNYNKETVYNELKTKAKPYGTVVTRVSVHDANGINHLGSISILSDGGIRFQGESAQTHLCTIIGHVVYLYLDLNENINEDFREISGNNNQGD